MYHFSEPLAGRAPEWMYDFIGKGYLAVDLFFVLSGYVIYVSYFESLHDFQWRSTARFLINRLIRIYPLHLVILLLFLLNPLAIWLFSDSGVVSDRYSFDYFFASVFLFQNWGFFDDLQWNIPAWSISTEFAAYIVCPFLISFGIAKFRGSGVMALCGLFAGVAAIAILFFAADKEAIGDGIPSLGVARCVFEFWIGLCVGVLSKYRGIHSWQSELVCSFVLISLVAVIYFLVEFGVPDYFFIPLAFSLLLYVLIRGDLIFSRFLSFPFLHYMGLISYSTYLVHYFIKDWVKFLSSSIGVYQFVVYLVLCAVASMVLYRFVEIPSRQYLRIKFSHQAND